MKLISYIKDKKKRKVWLRAFRIWQHRPHEVAPNAEVTHTCASCGTTFNGNYCPRCGQSARIGRFSFKNAALLFFDVWGVGNRSMFRSIRDLMLRPGYMIRDYLSGMQSAYFPPFKMFFLLTALSLLVSHGFSLVPDEEPETQTTPTVELKTDTTDANEKEAESRLYRVSSAFAHFVDRLRDNNPAIFSLLMMVVFFVPLYFFLRHSPNIPDLRYSEFVVALVYTSNAYSVYSIVGSFLGLKIFELVAVLIAFVSLRQFSGFSKKRLFLYLLLTAILSFIILVALLVVGVSITYLVV